MKTIFYSKESQFDLTEEEFISFIKQAEGGKKVWIPRLNAFLSNMFIWAGDKPESKDRRKLHDGGYAENKFGTWYLEGTEIKLDKNYYPELTKDYIKPEFRELADNIDKKLNELNEKPR